MILFWLFDKIQWLLDRYCLAQHKYVTTNKECWQCGYSCKEASAQ
jgi:hypothetical protein